MKYTAKSPKSLDEHHTHFILVDDGSTGEFGKEIELRAKLEECIGKFSIICLLFKHYWNNKLLWWRNMERLFLEVLMSFEVLKDRNFEKLYTYFTPAIWPAHFTRLFSIPKLMGTPNLVCGLVLPKTFNENWFKLMMPSLWRHGCIFKNDVIIAVTSWM